MSFELGRTYSGYEFLEVMKSTNTTVAYRVRNVAADREELLYVLPDGKQEDPRRHERFMREMGLRARLWHPNIPAFLNATELDGHLVMTTELVMGRTLAEKLEGGPLPLREAVALAKEVLSALACAHEFPIIHRGICPENIILTADGAVKLANFEMAKGTSSPLLTQVGAVFGPPRYLSPEQARGLGELDCRSDIYSVGAVLYHMLCGRPPFTGASDFEVMVAHVKESPNPPSAFHSAVPEAMDAVVLKALAKEPEQRYAACGEFAEALDRATAAPATARPSETVRSAAPVEPAHPAAHAAPARKKSTIWGAAAAGLVALVALVIWFIVRR